MAEKTSWRLLYEALIRYPEETKVKRQVKNEAKRITFDDFYKCLTMTSGLAFSEGTTIGEVLQTLESLGYIKVHQESIVVIFTARGIVAPSAKDLARIGVECALSSNCRQPSGMIFKRRKGTFDR